MMEHATPVPVLFSGLQKTARADVVRQRTTSSAFGPFCADRFRCETSHKLCFSHSTEWIVLAPGESPGLPNTQIRRPNHCTSGHGLGERANSNFGRADMNVSGQLTGLSTELCHDTFGAYLCPDSHSLAHGSSEDLRVDCKENRAQRSTSASGLAS